MPPKGELPFSFAVLCHFCSTSFMTVLYSALLFSTLRSISTHLGILGIALPFFFPTQGCPLPPPQIKIRHGYLQIWMLWTITYCLSLLSRLPQPNTSLSFWHQLGQLSLIPVSGNSWKKSSVRNIDFKEHTFIAQLIWVQKYPEDSNTHEDTRSSLALLPQRCEADTHTHTPNTEQMVQEYLRSLHTQELRELQQKCHP